MSLNHYFTLTVCLTCLGGCAMNNPRLSSVTAAAPVSQVAGHRYRDLTTPWEQRTYWSNVSAKTDGLSSAKQKHLHPSAGNAYLLGKYTEASKLNYSSPSSFARPHPPAVDHGTGPVSSPDVQTSSGVSYTEIAERVGSEPLPRGMSFKIWFVKGRDKLGPDGRARVKRLAQNPDYQSNLWLRGHTLSSEVDVDADQLSIGRALAVRQQLSKEGFAHSSRIKYRNPNSTGRYVEVTVQ